VTEKITEHCSVHILYTI